MTGTRKFDIFLGENVIITIDTLSSVTHTSEHGTIIESYPTEYSGILLDYDEENFYLGKSLNPPEVFSAVCKKRLISIRIYDENEEIENLLESAPVSEIPN